MLRKVKQSSNTNLPSGIGPFHSLMGDVGISSKSLNIYLKLQQQDNRQRHYTATLSRLKLHIIISRGDQIHEQLSVVSKNYAQV